MSPKLVERLCEDFPLVFKEFRSKAMEAELCVGIDCGDGWESIIRRGAQKLEQMIKEWIEEFPEGSDEFHPRASQVKEKLGSLRFYLTAGTPAMHKVCDQMEEESGHVCEECGDPGRFASSAPNFGWLKTVCPKHLNNFTYVVWSEEKE